MKLLLAALLFVVPGTWTWDASVGSCVTSGEDCIAHADCVDPGICDGAADGYLFCWSHSATYFTLAQCTKIVNQTSYNPTELEQIWSKHPGVVLFIQFYAFNEFGFSTGSAPLQPSPFLQWGDCP